MSPLKVSGVKDLAYIEKMNFNSGSHQPELHTKWTPFTFKLEARVRVLNEGQSIHIKITAASKPARL